MVKIRQKRADNAKIIASDPKPVPIVQAPKLTVAQANITDIPNEFKQFELIQEPSNEVLQTILSVIDSIGKPHPLLSALCNKTAEAKELYTIIRKDPELVAKVINVANSPLFGLSKPITNLNHAIVFLGIVQVKGIATQYALQETIQFDSERQKDVYEKIWSAGFLASYIVLELVRELGFDNGAELSTRCQLSYLGDLAIIFDKPENLTLYNSNVDLFTRTKNVQNIYKTNQAIIASTLAMKWNLPKEIVDSVAQNLLPFTNYESDESLEHMQQVNTFLCYISCRLADVIIFNDDHNILNNTSLDMQVTGYIEFLYTQEQMQTFMINNINKTISSVTFKRKVSQFLEEISL